MAARATRDMTVEEFDAWSAARRDVREVLEATVEEGGPRVSLVPTPRSVPVDFIPDDVDAATSPPADAPTALRSVPFEPQPSRKTGGWSAERQPTFIETLAETGSVHMAARSAGLSARSA